MSQKQHDSNQMDVFLLHRSQSAVDYQHAINMASIDLLAYHRSIQEDKTASEESLKLFSHGTTVACKYGDQCWSS